MTHSPRSRIVPRAHSLAAFMLVVGLASGTLAEWPGGNRRGLANRLHNGPGAVNHPVHVVPSADIRIPAGWALDFDGSITCVTCHEELPSLNGSGNPRLRSVPGSDMDSSRFCAACHDTGARRSARTMHWLAAGRAHPTHELGTGRRGGGVVDYESARCLGCHDGVTAGESANVVSWGGVAGAGSSLGDPKRNHPIGVAYTNGLDRRGQGALTPASLLPPGVRLPDGKVSCISCHDLYAGGVNLLAVPIEGSALCFTCHDMD